jgi:hypothetical protein
VFHLKKKHTWVSQEKHLKIKLTPAFMLGKAPPRTGPHFKKVWGLRLYPTQNMGPSLGWGSKLQCCLVYSPVAPTSIDSGKKNPTKLVFEAIPTRY